MALLYFKTLPDPGACDLPLLIPAIMILLIIFYPGSQPGISRFVIQKILT